MIYFDNAATSFPKPTAVTAEVLRCITQYCGNPGRGSHPLALRAAEQVFACREALADFFGLEAPERVLFTRNTTEALNLALKGFLKAGDHVLISELEHNATRRPLCQLQKERGIEISVFPVVGKSTREILGGIAERIRLQTRALVCTHCSNICSLSLPIAEIGALCHRHGVRFILDAAQSAGHLPIHVARMHVDALAAPAHKGLYGIQGAGILALGNGFLPQPLIEGGAGMESLREEMPADPPERYEAGTLPTPAIVSLLPGLSFLKSRGIEELHAQERHLFEALRERLESLPHVQIYAPQASGAVLLFNIDPLPSTEVAAHLAQSGICVRAGLHCAPMAHRALGTPAGGAVRVSFGAYNTLGEVDALWQGLKTLLKI